MKSALAIAATLLVAEPTGPGTEHFSGWPPDRYNAEFAAVSLFVADTEPYCGKPPKGFIRYGCAWTREDGVPVIVVLHPGYFPDETFARIVAHEGAHTLGWPKDHPL